MVPTIHIPDVIERDIDLLLLEEFVASSDFCSWFMSQIGPYEDIALLEAHRSVKTLNGESDLELVLAQSQRLVRVLIENKVDAAFQPNQPQRYSERAKNHLLSGEYSEIVTVVLAPEVYFGDEASYFGFDAAITYENILSWFELADIGSSRKAYKVELLRGAIDRGRQGWKLIPDPIVTEFWQSYRSLADQIAPELAMPIPKKEIPARSSFIRFRPAALPSTVSLLHKFAHGYVDLQFTGMGSKLLQLEDRYRAYMLPSMRIEKAAESAVIRILVDPIIITANAAFSDYEASVREALEAALTLYRWYREQHKQG